MMRRKWLHSLVVCLVTASLVGGAGAGVLEEMSGSVSVAIGGSTVENNAALYREQAWQNDGLLIGIEDLTLKNDSLTVRVRALYDQGDYGVALKWLPEENYVVEASFDTYMKFFDDVGGYCVDLDPSSYALGEDLDMSIGSLSLKVTRAGDDLPISCSLGYDYDFKSGTKSMLEWNNVGKTIYPAKKDIDEATHTITLDLAHETDELRVQNSLSYELYDIEASRSDVIPVAIAGDEGEYEVPQGHLVPTEDSDHKQLANALTYERQLSDNVFVSAGYLFVQQDGASDFAMAYQPGNAPGEPPSYGGHDKFYEAHQLGSEVASHVFSAGTFYTPIEDLSISVGLQAESTESSVEGEINRKAHGEPDHDIFTDVESEIDALVMREDVQVRYTGLPFSTVYAEASFVQDDYDHFEEQSGHGVQQLLRLSEARNSKQQYRVGVSASPYAGLALNAYYKMTANDNDYHHRVDQEAAGDDGDGYSALINSLDTDRNEFAAKVTCRPLDWLKASVKYQNVNTDSDVVTEPCGSYPGGAAKAYDYKADVISLNATVCPNPQLYLSATVCQSDTESSVPSMSELPAYTGDVLSFIASAHYAFSDATALTLGCVYADASNDQPGDLPLSVKYTSLSASGAVSHQFNETLSGSVKYEFMQMDDANYSADAGDFTAHGLVAKATKTF